MRCPNCNAEMPDDATFCTKCWYALIKPGEPIKKSDLDKEIEKSISAINVPLTLKIDMHLRLNEAQVKEVEVLKKKVRDAEKNFGEDAAGFKAYAVLGVVSFNSKKYEESDEYFNSAIKCEPERKEGYHNKGIALYCLGRYDPALEYFDKAIQIEPLNAISWYSKALTLIYINRLHEGIKCYENAVKINPELKKIGLTSKGKT